jgi:cell division protein FtsB
VSLPVNRRRRMASLEAHVLVLIAASLVGWIVLGFTVQYFRTYTLAREAARLERHRRDLLAENASLLAEIQRLRTDDQYLERLAREQLGMLRPGEMELVIVPAGSARRQSERDTATTEVAQTEGPWESLRRFVRNAPEAVRAALERALGQLP